MGHKLIIEGKRYDTSKLTELLGEGRDQGHSNGVTLCGVWKTKDGKVLVVTDSVWQSERLDGTCIGLTGRFADDAEIARLATRYGGSLWDMVPEGE